MRVFVAGASGVIGRALLPAMLAQGYEVFGLARTPEKLLLVDGLGAKAVRGNILDPILLNKAVAEVAPEVVVNLVTKIPLRLKIDPKDWEENNQVRVEGSQNLLEAARQAGVRLVIQESVGYVCASQENRWITETSPLSTHPFIQPTQKMEANVRNSGLPVCILRFASLWAVDSWHTLQCVAALKRGILPLIGKGDAYLSQIHAADVANAILCVVRNPEVAKGKTYNVCDNEPVTSEESLTYAARILNAPKPKSIPTLMAKMVVGNLTLEVLAASYRISNQRIREELGFVPNYPSYRELWQKIASELEDVPLSASPDLN